MSIQEHHLKKIYKQLHFDYLIRRKLLFEEGILHSKYLPQRGATFLLNDKNQVIYKFFSSDVLGYSSNMRDPLGFLSDLIKE